SRAIENRRTDDALHAVRGGRTDQRDTTETLQGPVLGVEGSHFPCRGPDNHIEAGRPTVDLCRPALFVGQWPGARYRGDASGDIQLKPSRRGAGELQLSVQDRRYRRGLRGAVKV